MSLSKEQVDFYRNNGYLIVRRFLEPEYCDSLVKHMDNKIKDWEPEALSVFSTEKQNRLTDDYFMTSGDKFRFFLEEKAMDENRKLVKEKKYCVNKAGHGLHLEDDEFRKLTFSKKIKDLVKSLEYQKPQVAQTMYIFKQPEFGGSVKSHNDSTFLMTSPVPSCLGLWFAMEDATLENGCLYGASGTHFKGINSHFIRNSEVCNSDKANNENNPNKQNENEAEIKRKIDEPSNLTVLDTIPTVYHLDATPEIQNKKGIKINEEMAALEMQRGDVLLIHGAVEHMSYENKSSKSRQSFQLHIVEGLPETKWSEKNWLQYPKGKNFSPLFETA